MKISNITHQHDQQIASIIRQSLEQASLNLPGTAYCDPQLDSLSQYYKHKENSQYWVLVNDTGKVCGGVGVGHLDQTHAELQKLYLAPEALGQGWGEKLILHAINYAKKHYDYLYLETFASLKAANHLYQKLGFEQLTEPSIFSEHSACDTWFIKKLTKGERDDTFN